MRQERSLLVPFVTLDQKALRDLAEHIDSLAAEGRRKAEAELGSLGPRPRLAADRARDNRIEAVAARRLSDNPLFSIGLNDGGMSDERWSDLWDRTSPADVRSVAMRALGDGVSVDVHLSLTSGYGSHVQIASYGVDAFNRELGWFNDYFQRYRAVGRSRIHPQSLTGIGLYIVSVMSLTLSTYLIVRRFTTDVVATVLVLALELCLGVVALNGARLIAPRVLIRDAGPHLTLRRYASAIALGVLTSVLGTLAVMLAAWVLAPPS